MPQKPLVNQFVAYLHPVIGMCSTLTWLKACGQANLPGQCTSPALNHVFAKPLNKVGSWLPSGRSSYVLQTVQNWGKAQWLNTTLRNWHTILKMKRGWRRQSSLQKGKPWSRRKSVSSQPPSNGAHTLCPIQLLEAQLRRACRQVTRSRGDPEWFVVLLIEMLRDYLLRYTFCSLCC